MEPNLQVHFEAEVQHKYEITLWITLFRAEGLQGSTTCYTCDKKTQEHAQET